MKVYVAEKQVDYEGNDLIGVFSTKKKAHNHLIKMKYLKYEGKEDRYYPWERYAPGLGDGAYIYSVEVNVPVLLPWDER